MNHDQVNYISMRRICNRLHTNKNYKFSFMGFMNKILFQITVAVELLY
eukprot:UN12439